MVLCNSLGTNNLNDPFNPPNNPQLGIMKLMIIHSTLEQKAISQQLCTLMVGETLSGNSHQLPHFSQTHYRPSLSLLRPLLPGLYKRPSGGEQVLRKERN